MKTYLIILEREDKSRVKRFVRFEWNEDDISNALSRAELKIKELELQTDIKYEIISIDKI